MLLDLIPRKKPDVGALMKKRDIPGLIRALSFRDPDVQSDAVHALGDIGPDAVGPLVLALKKRNRNLRLGAIGALAGIKDPGAVSALAGHDEGSGQRSPLAGSNRAGGDGQP